MTDDLDVSEYIQDVEYGDMEPMNISGSNNTVYLIPALTNETSPQVFVWSCIGSAQPEPAFNNRWYGVCSVPRTAVPSEVEKVLRSHEELLIEINSFYDGSEWDGHNHRGSWADPDNLDKLTAVIQEAMDEVSTYCEASNYFQSSTLSSVIFDDLPLSEVVEREVNLGTSYGMHLESDDVRDWIISSAVDWLNKNSDLEDLDEDNELLHDRLTTLLSDSKNS